MLLHDDGIDYMNANKLAQDHPCVIDMIRRHYLEEPSPPDTPYQLDGDLSTIVKDQSQASQPSKILGLLKNKAIIHLEIRFCHRIVLSFTHFLYRLEVSLLNVGPWTEKYCQIRSI